MPSNTELDSWQNKKTTEIEIAMSEAVNVDEAKEQADLPAFDVGYKIVILVTLLCYFLIVLIRFTFSLFFAKNFLSKVSSRLSTIAILHPLISIIEVVALSIHRFFSAIVAFDIYGSNNRNTRKKIKTLVVLGSGGHTMEILHLIEELNPEYYTPISYVIAGTDTNSINKVKSRNMHIDRVTNELREFYVIPRSREVGQSWSTTVYSTLFSTIRSIHLVLKVRPDLIVCNGPGTCFPVCIGGFLLRFFYCFIPFSSLRPKILFIESYCRVDSLSLTGKLLYPFVDQFIVHWPELQHNWPRSEYIGIIL